MATPNKEWHDSHKMPANPTPLERLAWHESHLKNCDCAEIPPKIMKMMPPAGEQT